MKTKVDFILYNARIYTVDNKFDICEAMAIHAGKIVATGSDRRLLNRYSAAEKLDAEGRAVFPGFIDAHAHFYYYGQSLQSISLRDAESWEEILMHVKSYAEKNVEGWILGRGWDHFEWKNQQYPDNQKLNQLFPDRPVFLLRVDEHAGIANQAALNLANIKVGQQIKGGEIHEKEGKLTGLLLDNALDLIKAEIPTPSKAEKQKCLLDAQRNCFSVGLTTIDDCGLNREMIQFIDRLQKEKKLKIRLFIMLSDKPENYDYYLSRGPYKTSRLNVSSFKLFSDGALGSRGAALLKPYADSPGWKGFFVHNRLHFEEVARRLEKSDFQMCTHAIGDAANRMVLQTYGQVLKEDNDRRWRIEHAQFVHQDDLHLFKKFKIIPSVQPTHATTDMHWAAERVGSNRLSHREASHTYAYAYQSLLRQNGWLPLGTDFPVEDINPLTTFYAAISRQDQHGFPVQGFLPEEKLSRKEALKGMTLWPAKLNFEENEKGSLEVGKLADFVILDKDIMEIPIREILQTKVKATYLGGEKVFEEEK